MPFRVYLLETKQQFFGKRLTMLLDFLDFIVLDQELSYKSSDWVDEDEGWLNGNTTKSNGPRPFGIDHEIETRIPRWPKTTIK